MILRNGKLNFFTRPSWRLLLASTWSSDAVALIVGTLVFQFGEKLPWCLAFLPFESIQVFLGAEATVGTTLCQKNTVSDVSVHPDVCETPGHYNWIIMNEASPFIMSRLFLLGAGALCLVTFVVIIVVVVIATTKRKK